MCFAIAALSPTRLLHSPLQAGVGATDLSSEAVSGWLPDPRQPAMQASSLDTEKLNLSPKYPYIVGLFNQLINAFSPPIPFLSYKQSPIKGTNQILVKLNPCKLRPNLL